MTGSHSLANYCFFLDLTTSRAVSLKALSEGIGSMSSLLQIERQKEEHSRWHLIAGWEGWW
jgi:hypothetical protein